jgi:hypothetical protein
MKTNKKIRLAVIGNDMAGMCTGSASVGDRGVLFLTFLR